MKLRATATGWLSGEGMSVDVGVWVDRGPDAWTRLGANLLLRRRVAGGSETELQDRVTGVIEAAGYRLVEPWSDCNGVGWWAEVETQ